ncbi:MAG: FAD-binding protein, partial [Candidatus Latescibacteria bacterium]|nr:FAD-binding protein [Candidatus Latescibacterota bacterium]
DAIDIMCQDAIRAIIELEHMGMPFSRTPEGKIAQRKFGGHTRDFGEGPVRRACYSADRTGHVMLHTLYETALKKGVTFFNEFFVTDMIIKNGVCCGVVAVDMLDGEVHTFHAKAIMFAVGGYGRAFQITSNAHVGTGDGFNIAWENGVPLEDMEFVQFHPTGLWRLGVLISEAARGEGGILLNKDGVRFMEQIAPSVKDLAPRDMVSRAIFDEVAAGRGFMGHDGTSYVHLDVSHLGKEIINTKLPEVTGFARTYLGVEPITEPIPVQPTTHYAMGGIPTDNDGRVILDGQGTIMPGFFAAGECACVSVHGANRLGTNSLLDIIVFGRRAGKTITEFLNDASFTDLPEDPEAKTRSRMSKLLNSGSGSERIADVRTELQKVMMDNVSVYREDEPLGVAIEAVAQLRERYERCVIDDKGSVYNTDLFEAMELEHLIGSADAIAQSARIRTE